jgi:hypothetical protein
MEIAGAAREVLMGVRTISHPIYSRKIAFRFFFEKGCITVVPTESTA